MIICLCSVEHMTVGMNRIQALMRHPYKGKTMVLQVCLFLGACLCSEYGERWHEMGIMDKKQNVFDDFQAAAEFLIENKYTTPQR